MVHFYTEAFAQDNLAKEIMYGFFFFNSLHLSPLSGSRSLEYPMMQKNVLF